MLTAVAVVVGLFLAAYFGIPAYSAHLERKRAWKEFDAKLSRLDAQLEKDSKKASPTPR